MVECPSPRIHQGRWEREERVVDRDPKDPQFTVLGALTSCFPSKLQPLALPNPGRATPLWTLGCCAVPEVWLPSPGSAPSVPWIRSQVYRQLPWRRGSTGSNRVGEGSCSSEPLGLGKEALPDSPMHPSTALPDMQHSQHALGHQASPAPQRAGNWDDLESKP